MPPIKFRLNAIGNTPLIRLNAASEATGFASQSLAGPNFSSRSIVKDRAALESIPRPEEKRFCCAAARLSKETAGNTGNRAGAVACALASKTVHVSPSPEQKRRMRCALLGAGWSRCPCSTLLPKSNNLRAAFRPLAEQIAKTDSQMAPIWQTSFIMSRNRRAHVKTTRNRKSGRDTDGKGDGFI